MAIAFETFFLELKNNVTSLATDSLKGYTVAAVLDGEHILDELKEQLQIWFKQVEEGTLTVDDFEYNMLSGKELMAIVALKQKGLALVKIDQFKNSVYNLITQSVRNLIL